MSLRTNFFGRSARPGRVILSDWVIDSLRAGQSITVFDDVFFSPLSIPTLVQSIEKVIQSDIQGTFNLGSRAGMSKAQFAQRLAQAAGLPASGMRHGLVADLQRAARRPHDMRMDVTAIEQAMQLRMPELADEIATVGRGYRDDASQ